METFSKHLVPIVFLNFVLQDSLRKIANMEKEAWVSSKE